VEPIEQAWIVTDLMAKEATKEGLSVDKAVSILRSAKALLNECHLNAQTRDELLPNATTLMNEAQKEIFTLAKSLGSDFEEKWTAKLKRALHGEKIGKFSVEGSSKFRPNMPRGGEWVRVAIPDGVKEKIKDIEQSAGVEIKPDGDSHVSIIGDKESIRKALDEISPYFKVKK
jgi:hypothetical protein